MQKLFEFVEHLGKWRVLVQTRDIQNGAVTTAKMADGAVTTAKIGDGEVKSGNIAGGAVTTAKIGDGEVKSDNIAGGAVTTAKIGDGEVKSDNIAESAVTDEKIEDEAIKERHIDDDAVTTDKIAPHAVTRNKIADEAVPELLGLMDEFVEAVREEISQQQPVTINGDVVNAADEEDLTVVDGLLKLKDRSGLYGYGMKILRRGEPFAASVTQTRCIYVVQYDFDLGGGTVTMPAESVLLFMGGRLRHGTLNGTTNTGGNPPGVGAFGLMLCSALYYDYLDDVTLTGKYQDETAKSLQQQIDDIVGGGATVGVTASPNTIFANTATDITLTATSNKTTTHVEIKKRGEAEPFAVGTNVPLTGHKTLNQGAGSVYFDASFVISNRNRTAQCAVSVVYPLKYGALAEYNEEELATYGATAAKPEGTPTTTVKRTYTMALDSTRRFIYFKVPVTGVTGITSVAMGTGTESSPVSGGYVTVPGVDPEVYRVWKSDDGFTGNGNQVFTVN